MVPDVLLRKLLPTLIIKDRSGALTVTLLILIDFYRLVLVGGQYFSLLALLNVDLLSYYLVRLMILTFTLGMHYELIPS